MLFAVVQRIQAPAQMYSAQTCYSSFCTGNVPDSVKAVNDDAAEAPRGKKSMKQPQGYSDHWVPSILTSEGATYRLCKLCMVADLSHAVDEREHSRAIDA